MHSMVEQAKRAIETPEVQEMLEKLSAYGLGIFMPHMHTDEEEFTPLPEDMVQVERELKVSFHPSADPIATAGEPVGWVWSQKTRTAMRCMVCTKNEKGWHISNEH